MFIKQIFASYSALAFNLDTTQRSLFAYFNVMYLIFVYIEFFSLSIFEITSSCCCWECRGMRSKEAFASCFVCIRAELLPLVSLFHFLKNFWPFSYCTHTYTCRHTYAHTRNAYEKRFRYVAKFVLNSIRQMFVNMFYQMPTIFTHA